MEVYLKNEMVIFNFQNIEYTLSHLIEQVYKKYQINHIEIKCEISDIHLKGLYLISNSYTTINSVYPLNTDIKRCHNYENEFFQLYILVPFRAKYEQQFRQELLNKLYNRLSTYLIDIDYNIVICEQNNDNDFNRGLLLNAGFLEIERLQHLKIPYYCHHNVDLYPIQNIDYSYVNGVRDLWGYPGGIGGICVFDRHSYWKSNGFPNNFLIWGGEDILLKKRFEQNNIYIDRMVYNDITTIEEVNHSRDSSKNSENMSKINNNATGLQNCLYTVVYKNKWHFLFDFD